MIQDVIIATSLLPYPSRRYNMLMMLIAINRQTGGMTSTVLYNSWLKHVARQSSEHVTGFGGWGKAHIIPHYQLQGVLHLSSGFATFIYHHIQFVSISLNHSR